MSEVQTAQSESRQDQIKSLINSGHSKVEVGALARTRFTVSLLVMVTMGLVVLISHSLLSSETSVLHLIGAFLAIFLASFGYEWCCVHSSSLTRHKRAHFDEANILETYQPRARLEGHLFVPDPPTPGPVVKIADGSDPLPERTASEKAAFNNNRDSHYANMYQQALQMAKEQEAMEKAKEGAAKKSGEKKDDAQ